jgi:hypothetical protein
MNTYNLIETNKEFERNTIKHILHNNNYDVSILERFSKTDHKVKHSTNKWAKFTYIGKETKFITKLFKDSSIKVTYTTNNTISKAFSLKPDLARKQNQFERSGVYQLMCSDCNMRYIGQTGRPFFIRFQEYFRDYKYSNKSKFALHLIENKHSIGNIDDIMKSDTYYKGRLMETIEKFYIREETRNNNQINDKTL